MDPGHCRSCAYPNIIQVFFYNAQNERPKQGARRTGGLAQRRLTGMIYGAVLAVNSDRSAHLEPTPDRWGRSGVRASRLRRAPGAGISGRDSGIQDGTLVGVELMHWIGEFSRAAFTLPRMDFGTGKKAPTLVVRLIGGAMAPRPTARPSPSRAPVRRWRLQPATEPRKRPDRPQSRCPRCPIHPANPTVRNRFPPRPAHGI